MLLLLCIGAASIILEPIQGGGCDMLRYIQMKLILMD